MWFLKTLDLKLAVLFCGLYLMHILVNSLSKEQFCTISVHISDTVFYKNKSASVIPNLQIVPYSTGSIKQGPE